MVMIEIQGKYTGGETLQDLLLKARKVNKEKGEAAKRCGAAEREGVLDTGSPVVGGRDYFHHNFFFTFYCELQ